MNYIINPKLVYWISTLSNLRVLLEISLIILVTIDFAILLLYLLNELGKEEKNFFKKVFKMSFIPMIIISLFLVFIPSKETMYKMIIFENITYENIEKGKETVKGAVDYIIEKIDKLKEEK